MSLDLPGGTHETGGPPFTSMKWFVGRADRGGRAGRLRRDRHLVAVNWPGGTIRALGQFPMPDEVNGLSVFARATNGRR